VSTEAFCRTYERSYFGGCSGENIVIIIISSSSSSRSSSSSSSGSVIKAVYVM